MAISVLVNCKIFSILFNFQFVPILWHAYEQKLIQRISKSDTDFYLYNPPGSQSSSRIISKVALLLLLWIFQFAWAWRGTWVFTAGWALKWNTLNILLYGKHHLLHLYVYCIFLCGCFVFYTHLSIFNWKWETLKENNSESEMCLLKRNHGAADFQQILVLLPKYVYLKSHKSFMSFLAIQLHHSPSQNMNTTIYVVGPYSKSTGTFSLLRIRYYLLLYFCCWQKSWCWNH